MVTISSLQLSGLSERSPIGLIYVQAPTNYNYDKYNIYGKWLKRYIYNH